MQSLIPILVVNDKRLIRSSKYWQAIPPQTVETLMNTHYTVAYPGVKGLDGPNDLWTVTSTLAGRWQDSSTLFQLLLGPQTTRTDPLNCNIPCPCRLSDCLFASCNTTEMCDKQPRGLPAWLSIVRMGARDPFPIPGLEYSIYEYGQCRLIGWDVQLLALAIHVWYDDALNVLFHFVFI